MADSRCLANIKLKVPPVFCDDIIDKFCADIQPEINQTCQHMGWGGDVPVIQKSPKGKCWCCCSCFAYYTQIAVKAKSDGKFEFKIIQDIDTNETVIATNPSVSKWEERKVTELGGIAPQVQIDFMYTSIFKLKDGTGIQLITTADHLVLRPDGKLTPIQDLRPGDEVAAADGSIAVAELLSPGQYSGGVRHIALGSYVKGDPLDGHLLNSEGIITADLSVQLAYYSGHIDKKLLKNAKPDEPHIGSTAYLAKYGHEQYLGFINDPSRWPLHFTPVMETLINVPLSALMYFSKEQSEDIAGKLGSQDLGDSAALATTRYLLTTFGAWYQNIYYIVDWKQELPNAYYFVDYQQKYIVITGGLARALGRDGLSIVLSHVVAQSQGYGCTGEADYKGIQIFLRRVWMDELSLDVFDYGYAQLVKLFDMIEPDHQGGDPDNVCTYPSIECRKEALMAGASMSGLPDCANPRPSFGVEKAVADKSLNEVAVTFSRNVNIASATDPDNYSLTPTEGKVLQAEVRQVGQNIVYLKTEGLLSSKNYTLTVENVFSQQGSPLSKGANTVTFKTP